ncbi:MAG: GDP-mannose 4,6-dehydratase [Oscillospiraceae bacterium]|nr:GDP-mannose 4,6-dehydratase [Oscillospiraceae bacterium]
MSIARQLKKTKPKALITGSMGFVGRHLCKELCLYGYEVFGMDISGSLQSEADKTCAACGKDHDNRTEIIDILDTEAVRDFIGRTEPDIVFHLAGQADVRRSWEIPELTAKLNILGAVNVLGGIHHMQKAASHRHTSQNPAPRPRVVMIGSADEYGATGVTKPIDEKRQPNPQNPYAISKFIGEAASAQFAKIYNLDVCYTRSFNHSGPGQKTGFIIPDFCDAIAKIERGKANTLTVGNLESVRDYTDVRDIARAYRLIAEKGISAQVYNVGSGTGCSGKEILDMLLTMTRAKINIKQDESRMRPSDTPILICDNAKLIRDTGWSRAYTLKQTLEDTLKYYRNNQTEE